jgi:hypothetical protein
LLDQCCDICAESLFASCGIDNFQRLDVPAQCEKPLALPLKVLGRDVRDASFMPSLTVNQ